MAATKAKTKKLPFDLETIEADRFFLEIYPDNKHWLVVLKGTEAGKKIWEACEPETETSENAGIWFDKIYGLYQEERQLLQKQIEDFRNEITGYQKYLALVAKEISVEVKDIENKLRSPFADSYEEGLKLEPYLKEFNERAIKLNDIRTRLSEDSIEVIIRKRLKIEWSLEETKLLHEGMKKALSDFISNEQNGWKETEDNIEETEETEDLEGKNTPSQTGKESIMTSAA